MQINVQQIIAKCQMCVRIHAIFKASTHVLQALSIMSFGYQWNLDFARPLLITKKHNKYILVMIEHFSKQIELVILFNKFTNKTTYAFLD